jgi:hypothetical protein
MIDLSTSRVHMMVATTWILLLFLPLEIEDMQYLVGTVKTHLSKGDRGIIHRRRVRSDPNAFTALKEGKQWDSWQRGTIAQARAQDLSEILDSNFILATPKATELFVEKQTFFYALFDKVLLTYKEKLLVRHYASTFDAQKVFRDLTVCANTSTMAAQEAVDLLTYITSS